jgi:hypothetical protein
MFDVGASGQAFGRHTNSPFDTSPDIRISRQKGSFVINGNSENEKPRVETR